MRLSNIVSIPDIRGEDDQLFLFHIIEGTQVSITLQLSPLQKLEVKVTRAGIFNHSMGARNRVGITDISGKSDVLPDDATRESPCWIFV